jgi:hypothetical protein
MLPDNYLSVFEAKSREDLYRECSRFSQQLGFTTFATLL